jgi:AcrR family transcriptional regulator
MAGQAGDVRGEGATVEALMDATERLLVGGGARAISTRRIAGEAGQSHGLIRYHFGSLEQLMVRTMQRASERILRRQRELYASEGPFLAKWRTAMAYLESDLSANPFPKLAVELLALGWNEPAYRDALHQMNVDFTVMLTDAVDAAMAEYGIANADREALATLLRTFQLGVMVERLAGIDVGHKALFDAIDAWLVQADQRRH